jgi:hypothetical protein
MSEQKLCPFINRHIATEYGCGMSLVSRYDSKPQACLEDECAMWRMNGGGYFAVNPPEDLIAIMKEAASKTIPIGFCGLAGRP